MRQSYCIVQARVQTVLAKDMIEPKRKYTDMVRVWDKLRAKKSGGPGGLLQLTLVQARELRCLGPLHQLATWFALQLCGPFLHIQSSTCQICHR